MPALKCQVLLKMARAEVNVLTLMKQLLGMGGLVALRLEESIDALPDQILPTWSACGPQSTRLNRDDFPCTNTERERSFDFVNRTRSSRGMLSHCSFNNKQFCASFCKNRKSIVSVSVCMFVILLQHVSFSSLALN